MKKLFSSTASICAIAAVIGLFCVAPALAQMAGGPTSAVQAQLQPPAPAAPLLRANAQGSQIYTCTAKPGGAGFEWTFKAPEATLSDASGKPVAEHFAGPTWRAEDGSTVVGEVAANAPAPSGQGIAWLLLKAKSHQGAGAFAGVSYIQRIETNGGLAPSVGCDAAHVDQEQKVPYTAVYLFYK
jgi:FtsP/CotA-like multicopper oxidase with cupredoxin domain